MPSFQLHMSFQLHIQKGNLGALNLYGQRSATATATRTSGCCSPTHAAVALVGAQHQHHSDLALTGRDIIGQAKGILMERYKIGADQAAVLVRASPASNRKLERHRPRAGRLLSSEMVGGSVVVAQQVHCRGPLVGDLFVGEWVKGSGDGWELLDAKNSR